MAATLGVLQSALSDQPYEDERSDLDQDCGPQSCDDKKGVGWR
jgi:hypothetical protein